MKKENILLGAHMSISGGLYKAIERGEEIGCTAIQIFTKSSRSWKAKELTEKDISKFKETLKNSSIKLVVAHACYLINVGSNKSSAEKKSIESLELELKRCEQLEIPYLVLHPGAHLGSGEEEGLKRISKNIDKALSKITGKTMLLLETTAGQGTNLGYKFDHLGKIRAECKEKRKIGVCFDTCHAYSAGYNFGTPAGYKNVMKDFDKTIGLKLLKVIHINDSKSKVGSRLDRHANIGKGNIPLAAFKLIMNDKKLVNVPKILETPIQKSADEYIDEIKLLKKMVKK